MRAQIFFVLAFFFLVGSVFGGSVGKVTFVDGDVYVFRNAQALGNDSIQEGLPIENYDAFFTGAKSQIEITFNPAAGVPGILRLGPNSMLYVELSSLKNEQTAGIELLSGAITLKASKMTGKNSLQVRTENAVMSVRGATFRVDVSLAGDLLVGAEEGRVECQNDGRSLFAEPGSVVQILQVERKFESLPVSVTTLEAFETKWRQDRVAAFKNNASRSFKFFATRYQQRFSEVQRGYDRLQREANKVIALWKKQTQNGTVSNSRDMVSEKGVLKGPLLGMRRPLFLLERFYFRLKEMKQSVIEGALSENTELSRGYTVKDFFKQFDRDEGQLLSWMAETRFLMKLYSDRNEGSFPADFTSPDFTKESDFFN